MLKDIHTVVIPGFIYRSLIRNKFNIVEFSDYSKLRKFLTIEDMACLYRANVDLKIDNSNIAQCSFRILFNSMTSEQDSEFSRSVMPLAETENIANIITNNLKAEHDLDKDYRTNETFYKMILTDDHIFIVLNEGFLSKISDSEFKTNFIKEYLAKQYSVKKIHDVSKTNMFRLYLKNLSKITQ